MKRCLFLRKYVIQEQKFEISCFCNVSLFQMHTITVEMMQSAFGAPIALLESLHALIY